MTMYICDSCGELCDEDELPTYDEDYGFDTGIGWKSAIQTFVDNCHCGGDFVKAKKCEICGEYFAEDDLNGDVCDECLQDGSTLDNAIDAGSENKENVEINGFLARAFTGDQIEEILTRELKEADRITPGSIKKDIDNYCLDDKSWFGEWLTKNT